MFKRVEKKLARKKEEEELGITEEIKDAVGLNDLGDSDDSTSDESEASSSSSTPRIPSKRKHLSEEDPDDGSFGGHGSGGASDVSGEDEDDYGFQMTVEEALNNPLFIVSIQPDIRGCIVCPRRVLKNDTMISVHMKSHAHQRRMSKFKEAAVSAKQDDDAREVLSVAFVSTPSSRKSPNDSAPPSKRAAKRIAKFEKMKAKRQRHKAAKARSIAVRAAKKLQAKAGSDSETSDVAPTAGPPKKKPKLDRGLASQRPPPENQPPGDVLDESRSKKQGRSPKAPKLKGAKAGSKPKLVEIRKR